MCDQRRVMAAVVEPQGNLPPCTEQISRCKERYRKMQDWTTSRKRKVLARDHKTLLSVAVDVGATLPELQTACLRSLRPSHSTFSLRTWPLKCHLCCGKHSHTQQTIQLESRDVYRAAHTVFWWTSHGRRRANETAGKVREATARQKMRDSRFVRGGGESCRATEVLQVAAGNIR